MVGIASRIEGTAFYEYHNVKLDWGVRDNGLVCTLFMGQTAKVCSLCGSVAHISGFCPMLANANGTPVGKTCFKY